MFILKKLLQALILPPAGPLLLILAGLWLSRRRPRTGHGLAAGATLVLLVLSIPLASNRMLHCVETFPPLPHESQQVRVTLQSARAIVVLGGGSRPAAGEYGGDTVNRDTLERLRYAARLQRIGGLPLLVSGGSPFGNARAEAVSMQKTLTEDFGVPVRWTEDASLDTAQNAEFSAHLLRREGIERIVLVTNASHMPRAVALFERQGLSVIPAPTGFVNAAQLRAEDLLPNAEALAHSRFALHEWLGRLWSVY